MAKPPTDLKQIASDVKSTFTAVVNDMKSSKKELAHDLGIHEMYISYWGNDEIENRHMPAYLVPEICHALKDFRLLDLLEHAAGRTDPLEFTPHLFEHLETEDIQVIQSLIKEVGEALQMLSKTLANHLVEDEEYPDAIRELNDVILECAKLKQWLTRRLKADRPKIAAMRAEAAKTETHP